MPRRGYTRKRAPFVSKLPRSRKTTLGRTSAAETPISIRCAGLEGTPELRAHVKERIGFKLGKFAPHIERVTVRFKDVNGPRGGVDTLCRIKVVASGLESTVVEELAAGPAEAFDRAADRVERAVRRGLARARERGRIGRVRAKVGRREPPYEGIPSRLVVPTGSLVGRRVGRSNERLKKAAERPEQRRRDYFVDTSLPGVSASERKAGHGSTARRNTKLRTKGMTATLEDSAKQRPSRKSTRKSANRAKQGSKLQRRQTSRVTSSKSRARRNAARTR